MIFDFKFINIRGSLPHLLISLYLCLCHWQKRLFSFFRAYVVDRSVYFHFFVLMSLTEALIFSFSCLCRWQKRLFSFFCAYVVNRSDYFHFFVLMSLTEALIFIFPCLCRWQKRLFSFFHAYVVDRSDYFHFFQGLDFPLSLILLYPIRNSLPFTSLRSLTVGSGRDFLESYTRRGASAQTTRTLARLWTPCRGGGCTRRRDHCGSTGCRRSYWATGKHLTTNTSRRCQRRTADQRRRHPRRAGRNNCLRRQQMGGRSC